MGRVVLAPMTPALHQPFLAMQNPMVLEQQINGGTADRCSEAQHQDQRFRILGLGSLEGPGEHQSFPQARRATL